MALASSKHSGKEEIGEGKHLLGVLKGKERQDMEEPQITVGNNGKQSLNCFPESPTFQVPAPPLLVPKMMCIMSASKGQQPISTSSHDKSSQNGVPGPSTFIGIEIDAEWCRLMGHRLCFTSLHDDASQIDFLRSTIPLGIRNSMYHVPWRLPPPTPSAT